MRGVWIHSDPKVETRTASEDAHRGEAFSLHRVWGSILTEFDVEKTCLYAHGRKAVCVRALRDELLTEFDAEKACSYTYWRKTI